MLMDPFLGSIVMSKYSPSICSIFSILASMPIIRFSLL